MTVRNIREAIKTAELFDPATSETAEVHETDLGNARRLVSRHGDRFRHSPAFGDLIFDGSRWSKDETGEVMRWAKETVRAIYDEGLEDVGDRRDDIIKHALKSESEYHLKAMIALARTEREIAISPDALDRDPWLLNVRNGTIDLRTGDLRPHRREDLITKLAPVDYDSGAKSPRFDRFLKKILNDEVIDFVQRAAGYSLTGDTREQVMLFCWGGGANGKSTLLETLSAAMGDYAMTTSAQTLMEKRGDAIPNDVARLKGARFVTASENKPRQRLDVELVKRITGGDKVSARFMRQEWFDYRPELKLWLATNHKPVIDDTTVSIWRRLRLIPFTVQIPDGEQDKTLTAKLIADELPGVLRWMVEGCLKWQSRGLEPPQEVAAATREYRSEMDVMEQFLEETCERDPSATVAVGALFYCYQQWATAQGDRWRMNQRQLSTESPRLLPRNARRWTYELANH